MQTELPNTAQLIAYLQGKLATEEAATIEQLMRQDDGLARMVQALEEELDHLKPEELKAKISQRNAVFQQALEGAAKTENGSQTQQGSAGTIRRVLAVAAMITVVLLGFWLLRPEKDVLAEFRTPSQNLISMRSEGGANERLAQALVPYDQGDYKAAIGKLEEILKDQPNNPAANFYLGVCYFLTDAPDEAIVALEKSKEHGDNLFLEEATWYIVIAMYDQGDDYHSIPLLEILSQEEWSRQADAKKLYEKLK